jgi:hypothetical protein
LGTQLQCPGLDEPGGVNARFEGIEACRLPENCEGFRNFTVSGRAEGVAPGADTEVVAGLGELPLTCISGCPLVDVEKICEDYEDTDCACEGEITIVASNDPDATAPATNCSLTDTLDPDGAAIDIPLVCEGGMVDPLNFVLEPGNVVTCKALTGCLDETTEDRVELVCDENDVPGEICRWEDEDDADCTCAGNPYKCYKAKLSKGERFEKLEISLEDQWGERDVTVLSPFELCNPVDKDGEGIGDPDSHLLCYKIRARATREIATDTDQFGTEKLQVNRPMTLCQPAIKNGEGELELLEENHYQCYRARPARDAEPLPLPIVDVPLWDQFGATEADVVKTSLHCNPLLKKDGEDLPVVEPWKHLKCYNINDSPKHRPQKVTAEDQWDELGLTVGGATRLCEEAQKAEYEPVCGNGILEPGEECETLDDCPAGAGFEFCALCFCSQ